MATEKNGKSVSSEIVVTPRGRLSYPHLFERNNSGEFPSEKYETVLLIPKSDDISKLQATANKTMKDAFGDKYKALTDLKNPPIRDGDEKGGEYAGHWFIKAKSDNRPQIVARDPKVVIDNAEEIYGGQYAKLSMVCFSYAKGGAPGVAWALRNVQVLGGGERFGGDSGNPAEQFTEEKEVANMNGVKNDNF